MYLLCLWPRIFRISDCHASVRRPAQAGRLSADLVDASGALSPLSPAPSSSSPSLQSPTSSSLAAAPARRARQIEAGGAAFLGGRTHRSPRPFQSRARASLSTQLRPLGVRAGARSPAERGASVAADSCPRMNGDFVESRVGVPCRVQRSPVREFVHAVSIVSDLTVIGQDPS
jgi:hypothetical protein